MLFAEVDITAVATEEGGREESIFPRQQNYMPHIRVQGKGEWLGVRFLDGPDEIVPGEPGRVTIEMIYHPRVDYSTVTAGISVDVVEGKRVVARGRILRVWETSNVS